MATKLNQVRGKPGMFAIESAQGKSYMKLVEWSEGFYYDTIEYIAGALALGDQQLFFQNLQGKQLVDTNLTTPRRLLSGQEMILNQIGIMPLHTRWNFAELLGIEATAILERTHYEFKINNMTIAEGPSVCFPPGMGVTGSTAVALTSVVTNGVASPAAVPRLLVPQTINEAHDLQGILTHHAAAWATYTAPTFAAGGAMVRNTLKGFVKTAVGKG